MPNKVGSLFNIGFVIVRNFSGRVCLCLVVISAHDRQELELIEVVGFIERQSEKVLQLIRSDEEGEIMQFQEVLIFPDKSRVDYCFRAAARSVQLRPWQEVDIWLKN
ncbi:MAG: hypothetical protein Q8927_02435 [Bacteroidota bacterium]|nr:hypothetical protein [Bacteroidota bacterium]